MEMAEGRARYCTRCIDKLGYRFRGEERLLDSGCGDGFVARLLHARVREVFAVDVAPSETWQDSSGLRFAVATAEVLPFEPGTFDVVHSKDSLHHMEAPGMALAEYRRVLKPGGTALIIEANRYNPAFYPHMTRALGHDHFTRRFFRKFVRAVFPNARFGEFEAHYVPQFERLPRVQHALEEAVERLAPQPLLAYNYAIAHKPVTASIETTVPEESPGYKILGIAACGYVLLPYDVIPDFIPFVGHFDDAIIVCLVLYAARKRWLSALGRLVRTRTAVPAR
jgi:SAM-dependent methyltransferase